MTLRFTDTNKWRDPWFRKLPPWGKLLWDYLCDSCDACGVWQVDTEICEMLIGRPMPWEEVEANFAGRIRILSSEKWLLPKFVAFQFRGKFDPVKDKYAASVVNQLHRHGLSVSDLVFPSPKDEGGREGVPRGCQPSYTILDKTNKGDSKGGVDSRAVAKGLRSLGLRATADTGNEAGTITGWIDLMTGTGGCNRTETVLAGIGWIIDEADRRKITIQYPSQAGQLADAWFRSQAQESTA